MFKHRKAERPRQEMPGMSPKRRSIVHEDAMYQIDTKVMAIVDTQHGDKSHLAYTPAVPAIDPTFCGREITKVWESRDVLGSLATPWCATCLRIALAEVPNSIKELLS